MSFANSGLRAECNGAEEIINTNLYGPKRMVEAFNSLEGCGAASFCEYAQVAVGYVRALVGSIGHCARA